PEDELIMFVTRMTVKFKNPFQKKKVIDEIIDIKKRIGGTFDIKNFEGDYPLSFLNLASEIFYEKYNSNYIQETRRDFNQYRRFGYFKFKTLEIIRYIYRVFVEINRRKLHNYSFGRRELSTSGLVVAFVGMDGSG